MPGTGAVQHKKGDSLYIVAKASTLRCVTSAAGTRYALASKKPADAGGFNKINPFCAAGLLWLFGLCGAGLSAIASPWCP
jgi:hypothetical protein